MIHYAASCQIPARHIFQTSNVLDNSIFTTDKLTKLEENTTYRNISNRILAYIYFLKKKTDSPMVSVSISEC
jgi:hypothetical protein